MFGFVGKEGDSAAWVSSYVPMVVFGEVVLLAGAS